MKVKILFLIGVLIFFEYMFAYGQQICDPITNPFGHSLTQPSNGWRSYQTLHTGDHDNISYDVENLCHADGYILVFEDQFDGVSINRQNWQGAAGGGAWGSSDVYSVPFDDPQNFYVNNGILTIKMTANPDYVSGSSNPEHFFLEVEI
jgi:hypothetical protein